MISSATSGASGNRSIRNSPKFTQNRKKFKSVGNAYAYINARPWDRVLEEFAKRPNDPIDPAATWKQVSVVSACLQIDRGAVFDAVVELDTGRLPSEWTPFVKAASADSSWIRRVPAEALMAIGGHLDISPAIRQFLSLLNPKDLEELAKARRIAQSLLGGNELLDLVLPTLTRDFGGFVTTRTDDRTKKLTLDGVVGFTVDSTGDVALLQDVDHGLETGMSVIAAFLSSETKSLVTVKREEIESAQLRSLSGAIPFPVAYAVKGPNLIVAGSRERLTQSLEKLDVPVARPRLDDHSNRFFRGTNQLIWFDAARTRNVLQNHRSDLAKLFANGSATEEAHLATKFEQFGSHLGLVDSLFIAGRIESDNIRIVVGGGLDSN